MTRTTATTNTPATVAMFRNKFWITLLLTLPTLVWGADDPAAAFGYTPPAVLAHAGSRSSSARPSYFYGGWSFLQGAWREMPRPAARA